MLQQGYEYLTSLAHLEPKFGIAAVAAGVSASASGVASYPPTSQLMGMCEKGSYRRRRDLQKDLNQPRDVTLNTNWTR